MAWGTDQCSGGGETSSAGVVDKLWEPLLAVHAILGHGRQDSPNSGRLTAPVNPESTQTSATRPLSPRAQVKCVSSA